MDDRTATTVRAVRAQIDSRPIALRSKSRRKRFQTVQNSSATIWRPVRPTTTALRSYWDLTAIFRDLVRKLVTVWSQPRCDWGISLTVTADPVASLVKNVGEAWSCNFPAHTTNLNFRHKTSIVSKISIPFLNFSKMRFQTPNFAFLDENFLTRRRYFPTILLQLKL